MTTPTSKLTAKAQIVVPRDIRDRLGLQPGDRLRYRDTEHGIIIEKATSDYCPFGVFTEWSSAEDEAAYANL